MQVQEHRTARAAAQGVVCTHALPPHLQVADETRAEFAKGLADAMKRSIDKKADHLDWEQRLEAASLAAPGGGGSGKHKKSSKDRDSKKSSKRHKKEKEKVRRAEGGDAGGRSGPETLPICRLPSGHHVPFPPHPSIFSRTKRPRSQARTRKSIARSGSMVRHTLFRHVSCAAHMPASPADSPLSLPCLNIDSSSSSDSSDSSGSDGSGSSGSESSGSRRKRKRSSSHKQKQGGD